MNAIKALIERMAQAPHEFAKDGSTRHTRWGHITDEMYEEEKTKPHVFTQEEIDAYLDGISKIIRAQIEEQICIEILNPLRSPDRGAQMELFPNQSAYPPGAITGGGGTGKTTTLTAQEVTKQALKILEQEMYKNNKPKKLIL